jgi:hypothetical protein
MPTTWWVHGTTLTAWATTTSTLTNVSVTTLTSDTMMSGTATATLSWTTGTGAWVLQDGPGGMVRGRRPVVCASDAPRPEGAEAPRAVRLARANARGRALALLHSLLTPEQWASWRRERRVELEGSEGRRYRVARGIAGNVLELDAAGQPRTTWCGHPDGRFGEEDCVISQILALTHDEAGFRRVANARRAA